MIKSRKGRIGSGQHAPARIVHLCIAALALQFCSGMAHAQSAPQAGAPQNAGPPRVTASPVPVPDPVELNKLVWSTMAAVHHANLAGNYSVLRDLAATGFQVSNDSAALAQTFSSLRQSGVDLSNTLLLAPTYSAPVKSLSPTVMQVKGFFGLRPTAIAFDLIFEWSAGRWKLFGVSIAPANLAQIQALAPPSAAAPAPQPSQRPQPSPSQKPAAKPQPSAKPQPAANRERREVAF